MLTDAPLPPANTFAGARHHLLQCLPCWLGTLWRHCLSPTAPHATHFVHLLKLFVGFAFKLWGSGESNFALGANESGWSWAKFGAELKNQGRSKKVICWVKEGVDSVDLLRFLTTLFSKHVARLESESQPVWRSDFSSLQHLLSGYRAEILFVCSRTCILLLNGWKRFGEQNCEKLILVQTLQLIRKMYLRL